MPTYRDVFDRAVQEGRKVQLKGHENDRRAVIAQNPYQVVLRTEDGKFGVRDRVLDAHLWEIAEGSSKK